MRNKAPILIVVFLIFPSILYAGSWEGKVVGVLAGDTIKVLKDGKQVKISLASIDCPERGQPYGRIAKNFTAKLVARMNVKVWQTDTDRYGRIVAFVFIDGIDLNKELLKAGLAWHYKKYSRDAELAKLEFQARSQKRGLWAEPNPVPPWEYRKNKRSHDRTKELILKLSHAGMAYHGDISSKIFHKPGCRYHGCKNCTAIFQNREAAIAAGFKGCKDCNP
jgi:endonuclease YncB( thermonuclease family)